MKFSQRPCSLPSNLGIYKRSLTIQAFQRAGKTLLNSEYDQEIPHTADQPTASLKRATQHQMSQDIRMTIE